MKRSEAFPSQYLSKEDLPMPRILHVGVVRMMEVGTQQDTEDKPVMSFQEKGEKLFILNSTNWQTIESAYGPDSEGWTGKPIELYADLNVMFGKERKGGVRVRVPAAEAAKSTAARTAAPVQFKELIAQAKTLGKNEGDVKAELVKRGLNGYSANRDTGTALSILDAWRLANEQDAAAEQAATDDTIPF